MSLVMTSQYESGSCPWLYWNETMYIGANRESHYDLIRRLVPDDMATLQFLQVEQGAVTGRVHLHFGEVRNFNTYSLDKISKETLKKVEKEFGLIAESDE